MLFKDAKGRQVMSTSTATSAGKLDHPIVDPHTSKIVAFVLSKTEGKAHTLHWADIAHVGPDAVTIESAAAVREPDERAAELSAKHLEILGKRVLTDGGDEIGSVEDLDFDPESGEVTAFTAAGQSMAGKRMIGLGSYALVVRADAGA